MPTFRILIESDADTSGFEDSQDAARDMGDAIVKELDRAEDKAKETSSVIGKAFSFAGGGLSIAGGLFGGIVDAAEVAVDLVGKAFSAVGSLIVGGFNLAVKAVQGAFNLMVSAAKVAASLIGKAFDVLEGILGAVFNKVTAIIGAATAFIVVSLGQQGAAMGRLEKAGIGLAKKTGDSYKSIVKAIKTGSQNAITNLDAMRIANEALLFDVVTGAEDMEKYTEAAVRLGGAVGRTAEDSIASLIAGLARQRPLLIDNIGIYVGLAESYEAYAKELGKLPAALTLVEKKLAFQRAVLLGIDAGMAQLGERTEDLQSSFDRLSTAIQDSLSDIGVAIGPALQFIADTISPLVDKFREWLGVNKEIIQARIEDVARAVVEGVNDLITALPTVIDLIQQWADVLTDKVASGWETVKEVALSAIRPIVGEVVFLTKAVADFFNGEGFDVTGSVLVAGFNVVAAQLKLTSVKAADSLLDLFRGRLVGLQNGLREIINPILEAAQLVPGITKVLADLPGLQDPDSPAAGFFRRQSRGSQRSIDLLEDLKIDRASSSSFAGPGQGGIDDAQAGLAEALSTLNTAVRERTAQGQAGLQTAVEKAGELGDAALEQGENLFESAKVAFEKQAQVNAEASATDAKVVEVLETSAEQAQRILEEQRVVQQMLNKLLGQTIGAGGVVEG